MSIRIDPENCIGCGSCLEICPGDLIVRKESISLLNPERCWGCAACLKICPSRAISMFLAPSIGGRGACLTVTSDDDLMTWQADFPDGEKRVIVVDIKKANSY